MINHTLALILTEAQVEQLAGMRKENGRVWPDLNGDVREWCDKTLKGSVDLFWEPIGAFDYLLFENHADKLLFMTWWT